MILWLLLCFAQCALAGEVSDATSTKTFAEEESYQAAQKVLKGQRDLLRRSIRRIGDQSLELDTFLSLEANYPLAEKIFSVVKTYPSWAIHNINEKPQGGNYLLKILGLSFEEPSILALDYLFDLSVFKQAGKRRFNVTYRKEKRGFAVEAESIPEQAGVIENAKGILRIYPGDATQKVVWIHVKGRVKLRSFILYTALPEKAMSKEAGERILIIAQNYLREEDRKQEPPPLPSTGTPKTKVNTKDRQRGVSSGRSP